jgi:hypothetical protein
LIIKYFVAIHLTLMILSIADKDDWGDESFLIKSPDWAYEEEWRLTSKQPGHIDIPPEALIGVIFGCRMSDLDRQQIVEWKATRCPPVKIYEAIMSEKEFRLKIHPI